METQRVLALEGGANFRDLGGYETQGGGRVRWGFVFRSAALSRLTDRDLAATARLGLRVVYDLRAEAEREVAPSRLPGGVRCEWLPIGGSAARTQELTDLVLGGRLAEVPLDFLERIYEAMAEFAAPTFGRLLGGLARPDGSPALIHCTAGKDRTGVCAALLLSVLGVGDAAILDDYELSAAHYTDVQIARSRARLVESGIDIERFRAVFGAPRTALASLLATLRERHGSIERYLQDEAGVAPEVFDALRARLVEVL
jgi:protein-tyrosine phosphatase